MTVDEIFSSESEHLYFRLIAARNALNAANDSDTIQVLNDILDDTLNSIDRIGTDEEIAAAEEIVVRKSNKTVKDYLSSQKFALIATAVMFVAAVGAALALLLIILGGGDISKMIKPIVTVVIIGGGIFAMAFLVSKYMKKRMGTAREQLNGRTVIGCNINTGNKSASVKSSSAAVSTGSSAKTAKQRESRPASTTKTKVYRNYFGVVKWVVILGVIGALAFVVFTKRADIVDSAKTIMFNIGIYDPAGEANSERFAEIRNTLINKRKGICYNEAEKLFADEKFFEAAEMYNNSYGYNDEIDSKITLANNCGHYVDAEELVKTSMYQARVELNKIKLPFSGVKIGGKGTKNVDLVLKQYTRYLDFTGVYGSGDDTFNIKDFVVKNNQVYIVENKLGEIKISSDVDREGYEYLVEKKSGEEVTQWYIATDHVLKVTGEEEKRLKK